MNKRRLKDLLLVITGNLMVGIAYGAFLIPRDIVAGGSSGIALIIHYFLPQLPASLYVLVIVWFFFFIGLLFFGKGFALKTLVATIVLPLGSLLAETVTPLAEVIAVTEEVWLVALLASVLTGVGMAIAFKAGGSTGGVDVLGYIGKKYFRFRISVVVFVIDAIIMGFGALIYPIESVLIGISVALITSIVIDQTFFGGWDAVSVQIITEKVDEFLTFIHDQLERGSTLLPAVGGFSNQDWRMIQVHVDKREFDLLLDFAKRVDPQAFLTYSSVEVIGNGFKRWRDL